MSFNIAIIEDEARVLKGIQTLITEHLPDVNIAGTASNIEDAITLLSSNSIHLVLLDVNLGQGTSFEVLSALPEINFKIVFITAFEEYALQAIKYSAFDYLIKPYNPFELLQIIKKVQTQVNSENNNAVMKALLDNLKDKQSQPQKLVLKTASDIYVIAIADIIRLESDGSYTRFFINDKRKILVSKLLKEYAEMLESNGFLRIHKSHLVNINYIDRYNKPDGGILITKDGSELPVSQRKREELINALDRL